jgi:hypothetical protein
MGENQVIWDISLQQKKGARRRVLRPTGALCCMNAVPFPNQEAP